MNVSDSNTLVEQVAYLRENIYNNDKFIKLFSDSLTDSFNAESVSTINDELGGCTVVVASRNPIDPQSLGNSIVGLLIESFKKCGASRPYTDFNFYMLINVVICGNNSFEIIL